MPQSQFVPKDISTGIPGLDFILKGGIPAKRIFLVHGAPGTGKTTLGLQFLLEGIQRRERVLFVMLLQSRKEIEDIFNSHGWSQEGVNILELSQNNPEAFLADQTLFDIGDLELSSATEAIIKIVKEKQPTRLVIDSLSELAILVNNPAQFRFQMLKLKRQLVESQCTTLLTSGETDDENLVPIRTLVQGVLHLSQETPACMETRRYLEIAKIRGKDFYGGYHDFRIQSGGLQVFPRLQLLGPQLDVKDGQFASGNPKLDAMLKGGLEKGSACMVFGTPGVGKSSIGGLYLESAARQKLHSVVFCFDETRKSYMRRVATLGLPLEHDIREGRVDLRFFRMGELSFGEFMQMVRKKIESEDARVVVIDSLGGMSDSLTGPLDHPLRRLHELISFLNYKGILTILIVSAHGIFGNLTTDINASHLVDSVILLRHFEARGGVHRCIATTKKRYGNHENTIREFRIVRGGVELGEPLTQFTGLMTGIPEWVPYNTDHLDEQDQKLERLL